MTTLTRSYVSRTMLDQELIDSIIFAVPQVIVQNQVAAFCGIHRMNLSSWLKRGDEEHLNGIESVFSQLAVRYHETRSHVVKNLVFELKQCPKNYQALVWLLEKCFREDFGSESEEIRELRQMFIQILPLLGKGDLNHGNQTKELDSKGNQETGSIAPRLESTNGSKNPGQEVCQGCAL